ncbi:zinc ABC transporter substrate-binding protein [uncultured Helicobacter sp.]|uniref:metal ABC transporter solute-binding protein, Zn/Mn family n=2 Tax=uncultured Helicobacter sp. TaxID=175537 RepID=UPI0025CB9E45|nr:zinc ABC transporter substrate-binding protein [uncultured Helicobacter sp.]
MKLTYLRYVFLLCTCFAMLQATSIKVIVSVLPQKEMIERIGGEYVQVEVLVPQGKSPEIYEPSIAQMKYIAQADIFFGVGMPFESPWLKRFSLANPSLIYYNLSTLAQMPQSHAHTTHIPIHNPHIWLSAQSMQPQVAFIADILSKADVAHKDIFKHNSTELIKTLQTITDKTRLLFGTPQAQKHFIVYHPAFEIFAKDFNLTEKSLENEGKEPKGKELSALMQYARNHHIKAIFIQPQYAKSRVEMLAKELNLRIIELDPLAPSWLLSLQSNACQIALNLALDEIASCMQQYFKE